LFTAARRLRELGILGMNCRNAAYILDHNPRQLFPVVDDKLRMRNLCVRLGVPTPEIYATVDSYSSLRRLDGLLAGRDDFVVKPNCGSAGRGELGAGGRDEGNYLRGNGERLPPEQLPQHQADSLTR